MLGVMGYEPLLQKEFWRKAWNGTKRAFWILNIPLLCLACTTYLKKSRVESMYFFYGRELKTHRILQEETGDVRLSMLPLFYSQHWELSLISRNDISQDPIVYPERNYKYEYILFAGKEDLDQRVSVYRNIYPNIKRVYICEPSYTDRFLHWLNPINRSEYIEIWETGVTF